VIRQPPVQRARRDQLVMSSLRNDAPVVEHENAIGFLNSR
jgi:hypothetical protein